MGETSAPYTWKQSLGEVDLSVEVPKGTRGRDVRVEFGSRRLRVRVGDAEPVVDGELHREIRVEGSTWTVEDQSLLQIHLEKQNQQEWWACVVQGHPEIDTTKIVPENSRLGDLDNETRAMVEKMMFDQRQKERGLPTSEERAKAEMLRKFQEQHPEMDFSQAKIN